MLWKKHLNARVRVHLETGVTIEGRLEAARAGALRLVDAELVSAPDQRHRLDGRTILPESRIVFGQIVEA